MKKESHKGFTLIELLVVIAIVAVLSVVVILTLNPAELLRQARDSNRISDMATIRSALSLYLADVTTPILASGTTPYARCYTTVATSSCVGVSGAFISAYLATVVNSTAVAIQSNGWIPVDFTAISSGAPLGSLPIDPVNNAGFYYAYAATSSNMSFKIVAIAMESLKYSAGPSGVVAGDGGTKATSYEVGTNLNL